MKHCLYCEKPIIDPEGQRRFRKDKKFCNQKCHDDHKTLHATKTARKFKEDHGLNYYCLKGLEKKLKLIEMFGGKCEKCGYDKNIAAFDFHHRDGYEKNFEIKVQQLNYRTDDIILEEALKCMLLCANCHRELHNPNLEITHVKMVLEMKNKKEGE